MTELTFKGKEFVYNHHLAVPFRPLEMHPEKGIGKPSLDGNLVIHGDNLDALKALLPFYAGKVDCVFIDPPYNTGNEGWSYNDNVNAPMIREWLEANPIGIEDGLRHDKWCAMMWPRLRLLHELLTDTGSFWATIDQIEAHRFKQILDEIFGGENFIGVISWEKTYTPKSNSRVISADTDFIICYAKQKAHFEADGWNLVPKDEEQLSRYSNSDGDPRGPWRTFPLDVRTEDAEKREKYRYEVVLPSGRKVKPAAGRHWSLPQEVFKAEREAGRIYFGKNGDALPTVKAYLADGRDKVIARTWWPYRLVGGNQDAKKQILQILGDDCDFITPKPTELIRRVIDIATHPQSIVLDSFSGSGSTAHAVLEANKIDGGNRRFILVEMEDYADEVTAERVRRVISGYPLKGTQKTELLRERLTWTKLRNAEKLTDAVEAIENLHGHEYDRIKKEVKDGELVVTGEKAATGRAEGLGGTFTYCTLGAPVELDKILSGKTLPPYAALGAALFHMATNRPLDPAMIGETEWYLGEGGSEHLWLIYQPDLDWLKSPEAALTLSRAKKFAAAKPGARHLVFAPARFVSQKMLQEQNISVEFVPLPFALYRIERS
ncbi:site-specific DNA-methyltransferase [Microbaculum marinisediminis]|uniref:site-specific DNA-methyltransferase (adenine-specific) n=1 Tax=Microbaculum marinisediminis TaxID=2931392 RepID=A0AAW5QZW0_9HYPH|nr:site-specific DNA-methyltransferase [Microbaculum sp. A6E488]MCT8972477.1 site-specific DNA-methyltransferase [Microbaculum sp. A6E488]